jgi:hypothetical protein
MDPLVISGRFGEEIHASLIDGHPFAISEVLAEMTANVIGAVKSCNCHFDIP